MSEHVQIKGACRGYKRGEVFELIGRGTWEQTSHEYEYSYQYRPSAELDAQGRRGRMKIEGHNGWIDVKKV